MFKHSFITVMNMNNDPQLTNIMDEVYNWMRNVWEHLISHYMYAIGGISLSWIYAYGFRDLVLSDGLKGKTRYIWITAAVLYGLCIGFVAMQFIKGTIVSLVLCVVYGIGVLGSYLYRKDSPAYWKIFGRRTVIQYYICSYLIGLIVTLAWIAKNGFTSRNEGAR